jgi:ferritin-like metal-binding protein YciE
VRHLQIQDAYRGFALHVYWENTMRLYAHTSWTGLTDLFVAQIQDLYDAEQRLTHALPRLAEAASGQSLKSALREHLRETKQHVSRLKEILTTMGLVPKRDTSVAMKALIAASDAAVAADGNPYLKDAALIAAAQRVEHFEIASYRTLRILARCLGRQEIVRLLQQTLDEEAACDQKLTRIAETGAIVGASRW